MHVLWVSLLQLATHVYRSHHFVESLQLFVGWYECRHALAAVCPASQPSCACGCVWVWMCDWSVWDEVVAKLEHLLQHRLHHDSLPHMDLLTAYENNFSFKQPTFPYSKKILNRKASVQIVSTSWTWCVMDTNWECNWGDQNMVKVTKTFLKWDQFLQWFECGSKINSLMFWWSSIVCIPSCHAK